MTGKLISSSLLLLRLIISCKPDVQEILIKSYNKCQSIENGYYEMTRYNTLTIVKDTPGDTYSCYFKKLINDSIYSSAFHLKHFSKGQFKSEVIYTGEEFVRVEANDSTAKIISKAKSAKDIRDNVFRYPFYSPLFNRSSSPLPQESHFLDGKHFFKFIGEENINKNNCYHIQGIETPEDEKTSPIKTIKIEYHFWISKSDLIPIQYSLDVAGVMNREKSDTVFQYTKDVITKYELNNLNDKSILTLQSIPTNFKIKEYIPENEYFSLLSIGTIAPNWQLVSLTNDKISLTDLKGKFVLIDFFHKGCFPCIKSIPSLQALQNRFNNQELQIIGIDPLDENESELADFLAKKGVTYTVLQGNEDVVKEYHVKNYPTMYLLDKKGKIIFADYGYKSNFENMIEKIIHTNH